jgi:hypothetical protein
MDDNECATSQAKYSPTLWTLNSRFFNKTSDYVGRLQRWREPVRCNCAPRSKCWNRYLKSEDYIFMAKPFAVADE